MKDTASASSAKLCLLVLAFVCATLSAATAAPNERHWYSVTITTGFSTQTFTGTSPLAPAQITARLGGPDALTLDDIREYYAAAEERQRWHQDLDKKQMYIGFRSILYFVELTADPLLDN